YASAPRLDAKDRRRVSFSSRGPPRGRSCVGLGTRATDGRGTRDEMRSFDGKASPKDERRRPPEAKDERRLTPEFVDRESPEERDKRIAGGYFSSDSDRTAPTEMRSSDGGASGSCRPSFVDSERLVERDERITGSYFSSHSDDLVPATKQGPCFTSRKDRRERER
ncbi:hypothetical protein THAOC_24644, partial [Thalassiosira oceanica]